MLRGFLNVGLLAVLMSLTGCPATTDTIILPEGPKATELGRAKDEQIKGLVAQVKAEQEARELEQKQASLVAANLEGILFAAEHVEVGLPRNAIEEEAKLGRARSPAADPTEVAKAKDRVIAILQNEIAKAKELYGKAFDEAAQAKAVIAQKNQEVARLGLEITNRDATIVRLTQEKDNEQIAHAKDVKTALDKKDAELTAYKAEQASKERRFWVNAIRILGLGFVVVGAVLIIMFKVFPEGIGSIVVGLVIGLAAVGFDQLASKPWFPYACGVVGLLVLGGGCFALWRMWVKHELANKKTAAIQDMIDEATIRGDTKAVEELKAHLTYRMGDKTSFWGKQQAAEVIKLGLVDPKGEAALKAAPPTG